MRTFLSQPDDAKAPFALGANGNNRFRGWQHLGENVTRYGGDGDPDDPNAAFARDQHEGIDLYEELPDACLPADSWARGVNPWPSSAFEHTMREYVHEMMRLGRDVLHGMAEGMRVSKESFDAAFHRPFWSLRGIRYPPLPLDSAAAAARSGAIDRSVPLSCGEYCDYGVLTFVNQDEGMSALQAQARNGAWLDAPPMVDDATGEEMLVMNVGDMLTRWTNGRYAATPHRVIHSQSASPRVSLPFFFEPSFDADVAPLPELLARTGDPAAFAAVKYGEHLTKKVLSNFES